MKSHLFHGLVSGIVAGIASFIYSLIYTKAMWVNFSEILNPISIFSASILGCMLASLGFWIIQNVMRKHEVITFNIILILITCASFIVPLSITLPFEIDSPELFTGMAIPMHLFPALIWIALSPLFNSLYESRT